MINSVTHPSLLLITHHSLPINIPAQITPQLPTHIPIHICMTNYTSIVYILYTWGAPFLCGCLCGQRSQNVRICAALVIAQRAMRNLMALYIYVMTVCYMWSPYVIGKWQMMMVLVLETVVIQGHCRCAGDDIAVATSL